MKLKTHGLFAGCAFMALASTGVLADGQHWSDGPISTVTYIRTVDGHFDDYIAWLAGAWKKQEEAAKKAGLITSYRVLIANPRGPNDPDVILVNEFKNWAAFDNLGGKLDAVTAQVEGSLDKANQGQIERAKLRTVLGWQNLHEAILK
jgi:hypothetical protein